MTAPVPVPRLRQAAPGDASALAALAERTFRDAFTAVNEPANIEAYVREAFTAERMAAELADASNTFILAFHGDDDQGAPIGYAKVRQGDPEPSVAGPQPVELERIYVEQSAAGLGLGSTLLRACLDLAAERGFETLWLGVWEENHRALGFYERWGFEPVGAHVFTLGDDPQIDLILERPVRGAVRLVDARDAHVDGLMTWFTDAESCNAWSGPAFRFPFEPAAFREDLRFGSIASYALVDVDDRSRVEDRDAADLAGFGQVYERAGRCHLGRIAVRPERRGEGLGGALMRRLLRRGVADLGLAECSLFVLEDNEPAVRLYRTLGFAEADYPGDDDPRIPGSIYMVRAATR